MRVNLEVTPIATAARSVIRTLLTLRWVSPRSRLRLDVWALNLRSLIDGTGAEHRDTAPGIPAADVQHLFEGFGASAMSSSLEAIERDSPPIKTE